MTHTHSGPNTESIFFYFISYLGSMESNKTGGSYSCRMAKTALNMLTRNLGVELEKDGKCMCDYFVLE